MIECTPNSEAVGGLLMVTWNDYKNHVRESSPEMGQDMDEIERISSNLNLEELNQINPAVLLKTLRTNEKEEE